MNRLLAKQDGIALVTALFMTLISLTIVMAVMYMISQNIQQTGATKRYKTALEASYGGTDIVMKEILPTVLKNYASVSLVNDLESGFAGVNLKVLASPACLQDKLSKGTSDWGSTCSQNPSPKLSPDMTLKLQATGGQNYTVYSKIVDTVYGNTDTSGLQLEGAGVAESLSVITPQHVPYVYRMEVQAEKETNAVERANLSVLYAY